MANKYDWKITAKKFGWVSIEVLIAGLLTYFSENPAFLILVPFVEAVRNWLKHKDK